MWGLWHFGDIPNGIGPFKFVEPTNDLPRHNSKVNFFRTKKVIEALLFIAIRDKKISSVIDVSVINSQELLDYTMPILISSLYVEKKRPNDLVINTIANRIFTVKYSP